MRKLFTTAAVAGLAAGALVAPQAADAAGPLADQLILCGSQGITVTVENLTYDSTGPKDFTLTNGCKTIVDGSTANPKAATPLGATYRVAFELVTKGSIPPDEIDIVTSSGQTRTVHNTDATVSISSLEGVQLTFVFP
jgi:hypothetical protein